MTDLAAVVVAAGSGRRFGDPAGVRKQFRELLGEPLLLWALRPFLEHPAIGAVVAVLPPDEVERPPVWLASLPLRVVPGGAERGDSVRSGLDALPPDTRTVLIHDGARPFVDRTLIDRVIAAAAHGGAVPGIPLADTLKEVSPDDTVLTTPPRNRFQRAQTPQGFPFVALRAAYVRANREGFVGTDDAAVAERFGIRVRMVPGDPLNLKVTTPVDLALAEVLAQSLPHPSRYEANADP